MTAPKDFLEEAIKIVDQRGIDNGYDAGQERSAAKIAEVFNALTGHQLTEADVWTLLICLKLVRNRRKYKHDNIVDGAGYLALLGECLQAEDDTKNDAVNKVAEGMGKALQEAADLAKEQQGLRPIEISCGPELDVWGRTLHIPRAYRTATRDSGLSTEALPEDDTNYRKRLLTAYRGRVVGKPDPDPVPAPAPK